MSARIELRSQILECITCPLHLRSVGPVPFSGWSPCDVAVLGEAPQQSETLEGKPFTAAAGQRLRKLLGLAGFDPDLFFCNTVSCLPTDVVDGKGRAPIRTEIDACRKNRDDQLQLADPKWVILTGNVPLQSFRPDLRIGKAHGRPFSLKRFGHNSIGFPVYHPAAVIRQPEWEPILLKDLETLKQWVENGKEVYPTTCYECGSDCEVTGDEWIVDVDRVIFCGPHKAKGMYV